MKHDLNRNAIAFPQDCRVPPGAQVVELKHCENCGMPFTRPKAGLKPFIVKNERDYRWQTDEEQKTIYVDAGIKFCASCRARLLMPPEEDLYREALPEVPRHPNHELVHYDDSLTPRKVVARVVLSFPRDRRPAGKLGNWMVLLIAALKKQGMMTRKEMIKVTGHIDERSLNSAITARGLKFERVANLWPRVGRGTPTGYYIIVDCE